MIFFAEKIALNVSGKFHTWIERLENKTQISFITCDCPVINLTGMEMGERHEFYYPLSPKSYVLVRSMEKTASRKTRALRFRMKVKLRNSMTEYLMKLIKKCFRAMKRC